MTQQKISFDLALPDGFFEKNSRRPTVNSSTDAGAVRAQVHGTAPNACQLVDAARLSVDSLSFLSHGDGLMICETPPEEVPDLVCARATQSFTIQDFCGDTFLKLIVSPSIQPSCCLRRCKHRIERRHPTFFDDAKEEIAEARARRNTARKRERRAEAAAFDAVVYRILNYMTIEFAACTRAKQLLVCNATRERLEMSSETSKLGTDDAAIAELLHRLIQEPCCRSACSQLFFDFATAKRWRQRWTVAKRQADKQGVLLDFFGAYKGACVTIARRLFGIGKDRAYRFLMISRKSTIATVPPHGLAIYYESHFEIRFNAEQYGRVADFLDLVTKSYPTDRRNVARINPSSGAFHKNGLWRLYRLTVADPKTGLLDKIPRTTFQDHTKLWMAERNFDAIEPSAKDHNCCGVCKTLELARDNLQLEFQAAIQSVRREDADYLETLTKRARSLVYATAKHEQADIECRKCVNFWKGAARRSHEIAVTSGRRENSSLQGDGVSLGIVQAWHIDGETSRQLPHVRLETTAEQLTGFQVRCVGFYSFATGRMRAYLLDHGLTKEDTSLICDLIGLNLLKSTTRDGIYMLVMDRFSVNASSILPGFGQLIVDDLGLAEAFGVSYYAACHGKGPADGMFGAHAAIHAQGTLFSIDQYAYDIGSRVTANGVRLEDASIVSATGCSMWREFISERTRGVLPLASKFNWLGQGFNEVIVARSSVLKAPNVADDVKDRLRPFITPPGWFACRKYDHGEVKAVCVRPSVPDAKRPASEPRPKITTIEIPPPEEENNSLREAQLNSLKGWNLSNRPSHKLNGFNFCKSRGMEDKATSERIYGVALVPEGYVDEWDNRVQMLTHVERLPAVRENVPASGPVCPPALFTNCLRGRPETVTEGLVFVDHRREHEPFLPMVLDNSSAFYESMLAFGESVRGTPDRVVRIADLLAFAARDRFSYDSPPKTCDLFDWYKLKSSAFGRTAAFKTPPRSLNIGDFGPFTFV